MDRAGRTIIGDIGFKGRPSPDGTVEIGYSIIPAFRRQGYAYEAARGMVDWALGQAGVKRVSAECLDDNVASIRVLEKLGMRRLAPEGNMLKWVSLELSRSTRALLAAIPPDPVGPVLDIGSSGGAVARWAASRLGQGAYCHLDLRACRAVSGDERIMVHHRDEPPEGPFSTVVLDGREFEPAYAEELVLRAGSVLAPHGVFICTPPDQEPLDRWQAHLAQAFREIRVFPGPNDPPVLMARDPLAVPAGSAWDAWVAEIAESQFRFRSGPGVFSPRGLDAGTRAMIEAMPAPAPGASFLDLGCGVGVVSVMAATLWGCQVTAVDVNARALRLTAINARENGVEDRVRVLASDGFSDLPGSTFSVIATNPPYHADYAVAKAFIEGTYRHLSVGGALWVVVKQADWYINKLRAVFGGCRVLERDGYFVLTAERREAGPARNPLPKAAPRKHLKRLRDAAERRGKRKNT